MALAIPALLFRIIIPLFSFVEFSLMGERKVVRRADPLIAVLPATTSNPYVNDAITLTFW